MYLPIWVSGEPAPSTGYRDILNGVDILLRKTDRLPLGPDGRVTLYVPLIERREPLRTGSTKDTTCESKR